MNDNTDYEGPAHRAAMSLISDLYLILRNMAAEGIDRHGADGHGVYQPDFWAKECAKILGIKDVEFRS